MKKILIVLILIIVTPLMADSLKVYIDECSFIASGSNSNFGAYTYAKFGYYNGNIDYERPLFRANYLDDSLNNHSGATIDSTVFYAFRVGGTLGTSSYYLHVYRVLQTGWHEGTGVSGGTADTCGVDYYWAYDTLDTDGAGDCDYAQVEWATAYCENTTTDRTSYWISVEDSMLVNSTTFPSSELIRICAIQDSVITNDSLAGGFILTTSSFTAGGDNYEDVQLGSDDHGTEAQRPYLMIYYTASESGGSLVPITH